MSELTPEEIELLALKYGREICDCPTLHDVIPGQPKSTPMKRVSCWRCRVNFGKKYGAQLSEDRNRPDMEKLADVYGVIRYGENAYKRYKTGEDLVDDWALFQYELDQIFALFDEEGIREELQLADKNYLDLKNTFDDRVAAAKREEKERIINEMEEANELNGEPWGEHYHYAYGYDPVEEGSLIIEKDKWQALKEGIRKEEKCHPQ